MDKFAFNQQFENTVTKQVGGSSQPSPQTSNTSEKPNSPYLSKKPPPPLPPKPTSKPSIRQDSPERPKFRNRTSDPIEMEKKRSWREKSINEENESRFTGSFYKILKESVDTESKYIQDLELLFQYYELIVAEFKADPSERLVDPIPEGLTKAKIKTIFQHVPSLLSFHQEHFPEFQQVTSEPKLISQVLLKKKNKILRLYGDFIINMQSNIDTLQEFEDYFDELREKADFEQRLNSVFITPMQRITRYPLLLKSMIKEAEKSTDKIDKAMIKDVLARTEEITGYVNKVKEAGAIKKLPVRYYATFILRKNNQFFFIRLMSTGELWDFWSKVET